MNILERFKLRKLPVSSQPCFFAGTVNSALISTFTGLDLASTKPKTANVCADDVIVNYREAIALYSKVIISAGYLLPGQWA